MEERSRYGLMVSALGAFVLAISVYLPWYHVKFSGLTGHSFATLDAHQIFKYMSVVLLVLAGLALLDVLMPLTNRSASIPDGAGGSTVLLGILAGLYIAFRMIDPQVALTGQVALSVREGAWLALIGAAAMALGGMWPHVTSASPGSDAPGQGMWSALTSWTPER